MRQNGVNSASQLRDLWVGIQDSLNGWRTVGLATQIVNGSGTALIDLPIAGDARSGPGYLWVVRLLPVNASSHEDAFDARYAEVAVGDPSVAPDLLLNVSAPTSLYAGETAVIEVEYSAAATRELAIYLQDSENGWFTSASLVQSVPAGQQVLSLNVPIIPGARFGDGHVWVVRLLPEFWQDHTEALAAYYADASIIGIVAALGENPRELSPQNAVVTPRSATPLTVRADTEGRGIVITWKADSNIYQLQTSDNLSEWRDVEQAPSEANAQGLIEYLYQAPVGQRYYRLINPMK